MVVERLLHLPCLYRSRIVLAGARDGVERLAWSSSSEWCLGFEVTQHGVGVVFVCTCEFMQGAGLGLDSTHRPTSYRRIVLNMMVTGSLN